MAWGLKQTSFVVLPSVGILTNRNSNYYLILIIIGMYRPPSGTITVYYYSWDRLVPGLTTI